MKEITIVINISENPSGEMQSRIGQKEIPHFLSRILYYDDSALVGVSADGSVYARFQSDEEDSLFKITFTALPSFQQFGLSSLSGSGETDYFANEAGILEFRLPVKASETMLLKSV